MAKGIYKLTSPSGKCYIGQSINLNSRLANYRLLHCKKQRHLYNAIKKYGWESFNIEILWSINCDFPYIKTILNKLEIKYIEEYNSINNGYNLTKGGNSELPSKETRLKMSISAKNMTQEHKNNISKSKMGHSVSEETRQKLSKINKGKTLTEEHKNNISISVKGEKNGFYGKKHTDKTKEYLSILEGTAIIQKDFNNNIINNFNSICSASKILGIKKACIVKRLNGWTPVRKTKYNYTFIYA